MKKTTFSIIAVLLLGSQPILAGNFSLKDAQPSKNIMNGNDNYQNDNVIISNNPDNIDFEATVDSAAIHSTAGMNFEEQLATFQSASKGGVYKGRRSYTYKVGREINSTTVVGGEVLPIHKSMVFSDGEYGQSSGHYHFGIFGKNNSSFKVKIEISNNWKTPLEVMLVGNSFKIVSTKKTYLATNSLSPDRYFFIKNGAIALKTDYRDGHPHFSSISVRNGEVSTTGDFKKVGSKICYKEYGFTYERSGGGLVSTVNKDIKYQNCFTYSFE